MNQHNEQFTPKTVDAQVDNLLQSQPVTSPDVQMAHDLSQLYTEKPGSLELVWHRLGLDEHMSFSDAIRQRNTPQERMTDQTKMTRDERNHSMLSSSHNPIPQHSFGRRFAVLVAVLVAALLVGSALLVVNRVTHSNQGVASPNIINQPTASQEVKTPEGVYVGGRDGIARLDRYTGKTLWKYNSPPKDLLPKKIGSLKIDPLPEKIIALGNIVYVSMEDYGNTTSAVLAIDAQSGHLRWSHTFKGSFVNDLVTAGNRLYVGNYDLHNSTIYVFDATSGAQHATYQISGDIMTLSVANNVLYVGSSPGLSAFSLSDGKRLWYNASVDAEGLKQSYVVNKVVYIVASEDKSKMIRDHVVAVNANTGGKLWQDDFQDEVTGLAVVNGKVFVATVTANAGPSKGKLYMYNAHDGKIDWSTNVDGMVEGSPIVYNNLVYVSIGPDRLPSEVAALTLANGHIQWQTKTLAVTAYTTQAVVSNGVVYVSSHSQGYTPGSSSTITALNAATGSPLWTVPSVAEDIFTLMVAD